MILFAILNENGVAINKEKPQVINLSRSVDDSGKISLLFSLANGTAKEINDIIGEYCDRTCQVYKTESQSYVFTS